MVWKVEEKHVVHMLRVTNLRDETILLNMSLMVSVRPIDAGVTRITLNTSPPTDYDVKMSIERLEELFKT